MTGLAMAAACTALLIAGPAAAQTWEVMDTTAEARSAIDTSTIRRSGSTVTYWQRVNYSAPMRLASGRLFDEAVSLVEANCDDLSWRLLQMSATLARVVAVPAFAPSAPRAVAAPGTRIHFEIMRACAQ